MPDGYRRMRVWPNNNYPLGLSNHPAIVLGSSRSTLSTVSDRPARESNPMSCESVSGGILTVLQAGVWSIFFSFFIELMRLTSLDGPQEFKKDATKMKSRSHELISLPDLPFPSNETHQRAAAAPWPSTSALHDNPAQDS